MDFGNLNWKSNRDSQDNNGLAGIYARFQRRSSNLMEPSR
jgi:hypothetical protein